MEQVIIDFIMSLIPQSVIGQAVGLIPVALAAVAAARKYIPFVEAHKKVAAPVLAAMFGVAGGFYLVGFEMAQYVTALQSAAVIFLGAVGLYSTGKNVMQSK